MLPGSWFDLELLFFFLHKLKPGGGKVQGICPLGPQERAEREVEAAKAPRREGIERGFMVFKAQCHVFRFGCSSIHFEAAFIVGLPYYAYTCLFVGYMLGANRVCSGVVRVGTVMATRDLTL